MARNEEKAQALLNKWVTMKKDLAKGMYMCVCVCVCVSWMGDGGGVDM